MKKVKYVIVLFVSMMATISCSEDDVLDLLGDDDSKALLGTWGFQESEDGFEIDFSITFNNNFTGVMVATITDEGETESATDNFTWATDGSQLTIDGSDGIETLQYSISGNKLSITEDDGELLVLTKR